MHRGLSEISQAGSSFKIYEKLSKFTIKNLRTRYMFHVKLQGSE